MECKVANPFRNNSHEFEMLGFEFRFLACQKLAKELKSISKTEKEVAFLQQNRNSTKSMIGTDGEEVASR